jgi:hypothetical protein
MQHSAPTYPSTPSVDSKCSDMHRRAYRQLRPREGYLRSRHVTQKTTKSPFSISKGMILVGARGGFRGVGIPVNSAEFSRTLSLALPEQHSDSGP